MSRLFGKALHAAYVLPDIDGDIERLLALGIGPVFTIRDLKTAAIYRGERHDPVISAAFAYSGTMQIELLMQHDDTPSAAREFLKRRPEGGLHHFAYFSDDFAATLKGLEDSGHPYEVVQEYIDDAGVPYEIYIQPAGNPDALLVQLVHPGPLGDFYDRMYDASVDWDGSDPVRSGFDVLDETMRPPAAE